MHLTDTSRAQPVNGSNCKRRRIEPVVWSGITDIDRPSEVIGTNRTESIGASNCERLTGLRTSNGAGALAARGRERVQRVPDDVGVGVD